jgi:hypothetical protein
MALILCEGFDHYNGTSDISTAGWVMLDVGCYTETEGSLPMFIPGRFSGTALVVGQYSSLNSLSLGTNLSEIFLGLALKLYSINGNYYTRQISLRNGSTVIGRVVFDPTSFAITLQLYNATTSNYITVAATVPGAFTLNTWMYLEIRLKLSSTDGAFVVRVNNEVVASVFNLSTSLTGQTQMNVLALSGLAAAVDDLYVCDASIGPGAYPMNALLGEKRVFTMWPKDDVVSQFTSSGPYSVDPNPQSSTSSYYMTAVANRVYLGRWQTDKYMWSNRFGSMGNGFILAKRDCTINSFGIMCNNNLADIKCRPVIYTEDANVPNQPGALLAVGNEYGAFSAGLITLTFPAGVNLLKGKKYFIGFISNTSFDIRYDLLSISGGVPAWSYTPSTYPSVPATFPYSSATSVGSSSYFVLYNLTFTPMANHGAVQETYGDGASTYNMTGGVGLKDLFTTDGNLSTDASIFAVQVTGMYAKDDANPRTIANLIKSGSTEAVGATYSLGSTFTYKSTVWAINPATGSPWTVAEANAAQIGYKTMN